MTKIITLIALAMSIQVAQAQLGLTQYNMRLLQQSSFNNPSFTPSCKVTVGGILFGSTTLNYGNSGFSKATIGKFGKGMANTVEALDAMQETNTVSFDFRRDLVHFGFYLKEKHYLGLNASLRSNTNIYYPRDIFTMIFVGNGVSPTDPGASAVPTDYQLLGKRASFLGTGVDHSTFAEIGLQYSVKLLEDDRLQIGARPKMVFGFANVNTAVSNLGLTTDEETFGLTLDGSYEINTSIPVDDSGSFAFPGTTNRGFGLDLGASFNITENIQVSASVIDIGSITWNNQPRNYFATDGNWEFNGFELDGSILDVGNSTDTIFQGFLDKMLDSLNNQFGADTTDLSYKTSLPTNFNLAGNLHFGEKHNVGALINLRKPKDQLKAAFTLSYGYEINKKYSLHANYSIYNRSFVNLGLGASARLGPFQFYAMTDNILGTANFMFPFLPWATKNRNFTAGMNWKFGCKEDKDKDGIKDKDDDCPEIPGELNFKGCPDTDKDGVMDKEDRCPETPGPIEFKGCPDRDGDGIVDVDDACPDAPGIAEFKGCPDTDGDGIADAEDLCPTTAGIVEFSGCPDTDGDGIQDSEDECPEKPGILAFQGCPDTDGDGLKDSEDECPEKPGPKDKLGCPDTDNDGLTDNKDNCPEVAGPVDNQGCPFGDRDGDGVIDNEDSCPDTAGPAENAGCPYSDIDGDGVYDKDDRCPQTPGVVENQGCPEIKQEEQEVLNTAFANLEFETGKAVIAGSSFESLDKLAELLVTKTDWKLEIAGHTDNVGSDAANMTMSEKRAKAVGSYLNSKGVANDRLIVKWFGESQPIADNDTPEGRAKNRRVEMQVVFE